MSLFSFLDLRVKTENDYHGPGYNTSPPPATSMPQTNYHEKPITTSPLPAKPSPDTWPAKIITSKSGGIATADGTYSVILFNCALKLTPLTLVIKPLN